MNIQNQLHTHIGNDRLDKAIELLKTHFRKDAVLYSQTVQFENQIKHAQFNYNSGLIAYDDYTKQLAKAQQGLIEIAKQAKDTALPTTIPYKKAMIPAALILFALSIFFYTNYQNREDMKKTMALNLKEIKPEIEKLDNLIDKYIKSIDKNKSKIYKNEKDDYGQYLDSLKASLDWLPSQIPNDQQDLIYNLESIKMQIQLCDSTYKSGYYQSEEAWGRAKKAVYKNLGQLNDYFH